MLKVKAQYINIPSKNGTDYFIYTDIEIIGHSEQAGSYTNNIRLCAGVSACCYGIRRLIDDSQFNIECKSGYYHVWTNRTKNLKIYLDKASVYALNTLVCQLFELYNQYPSSFKSFELVDVKEKIESYERKQTNKPRKHKKGMGLLALIEDTYLQEN
jgi:uncharacterized protein YsxB (DUF464 family)